MGVDMRVTKKIIKEKERANFTTEMGKSMKDNGGIIWWTVMANFI